MEISGRDPRNARIPVRLIDVLDLPNIWNRNLHNTVGLPAILVRPCFEHTLPSAVHRRDATWWTAVRVRCSDMLGVGLNSWELYATPCEDCRGLSLRSIRRDGTPLRPGQQRRLRSPTGAAAVLARSGAQIRSQVCASCACEIEKRNLRTPGSCFCAFALVVRTAHCSLKKRIKRIPGTISC
jgi:hypothetical protein